MEKFILEEFQEEFKRFFQFENVNYEKDSLTTFFACNRWRLPHYYKNKYLSYYDIDLGELELLTPPIHKTIEIENIYGRGWLFEGWEGTDRPIPERLADCHLFDHDNLLPIPAYELSASRYYIPDGNHRLYSAYLRGWNTIQVSILKTYKKDSI